MKAIVCHRYSRSSDVLQFEETERPIAADDEVLIRVRAASVNPVDAFPLLIARLTRAMSLFAAPKSDKVGTDVAGVVEAVGRNVTMFRPGDEVFGVSRGAFAEFACTREPNLARKPRGISFDEAAAVPVAALTALQGLRDKGGIKPGHRVLIDGASGGVGTFAIQIAKAFGAHVTAVCSTRNVGTARSIGADSVIDYTQENFARRRQRYDLILAANAHRSVFSYWRALNPDGICVVSGGSLPRVLPGMPLAPLLSSSGRKRVRFFVTKPNHADLVLLTGLLDGGKVISVIDRRYPLHDTATALRYLKEGHARGKVVITVGAD